VRQAEAGRMCDLVVRTLQLAVEAPKCTYQVRRSCWHSTAICLEDQEQEQVEH